MCLILGALTVMIGTGLLGSLANQVGSAFGNALTHLTSQAPATPPPSGVALDTPVFDAPPNGGYTNANKMNLTGSLPAAAIGQTGYMVRVYAIDAAGNRRKVFDIAVGAISRFVSPEVTLIEGQNVFTAVLVTPDGEGAPSPTVTYILDTIPPKITVSSPAAGSLIKSNSVDVVGHTDPGASVSIQNQMATGGAMGNQIVGSDGKFRITVALVANLNTIVITSTDQAGNPGTYTLTVKRDPGQLAAHLTVSSSKFKAASQVTLKLTVHATAQNGSPLPNASVTFTVQIQGIPGTIISGPIKTNATGTATWSVAISGATPGIGQVSAWMTTSAGDGVPSGSVRITTT